MTTHPDEAAFGFSETRYNEEGQAFSSLTRRGLTKREYFAARAMQGLMGTALSEIGSCAMVAAEAVKQADALIAALNEGGQANG